MHSRYPTPRSAALLLALALSAASAAEPRYDVLDLRTLGFSDAFALNNLGHVAGRNESGEVLLWNGSTVSSTSLDSATPAIMDLNDLGSIVGTYTDPSLGEDFAFVLTAGELTKLQGFDVASAINNRGQIVLNSFGGSADAFIYQNGTSVALGSLGGTDTFPAAINTSGAVVGGSTPVAGSEHQHAFLYHNGSTTDLGTLGGQRSSANDINDAGNIVGHSYGNTEEFQAVIYTVGRALPLIPHQPGTNSSGLKINNYNVIAGHLPLAGIWSGGVLKLLADFADFESFGVRPAIADFNDRGQILVRGWMRDPIMRSIPLLLTPRPTPPARLTALAARSIAGANDQTSIAGFVVAGNSNGSILLRTVGPGLTPLGVTNAAADPAVKIFNSANTVVAANDNWSADESAAATLSSTATRLGAQPLAADSADAALLADLPAGAYTAHASNPADPSRIVLTEIYDAATKTQPASPRPPSASRSAPANPSASSASPSPATAPPKSSSASSAPNSPPAASPAHSPIRNSSSTAAPRPSWATTTGAQPPPPRSSPPRPPKSASPPSPTPARTPPFSSSSNPAPTASTSPAPITPPASPSWKCI